MFHRSAYRGYEIERQRLLEKAATLDPTGAQYKDVMSRIDQLDQIIKRSSESFKTVIPASATVVSVVGIYVIQQFAGVVVPKALDMLTARGNKSQKDEQS